nr:putative UDP-rhamnose:rhamnosyltransferase 1 [Ipomoea batatas]GME08197.1 putative UDP-rhamnose:rhamnosyltransferase 1 [Ipomoea batatas]
MAAEQCHVTIFPWLAFGHMLPMFEFAKKLAAKGFRVSFVSTPKNLQRLPPIPASFMERLSLREISLPSVPGLPENCEATVDLEQKEQIQFLKMAYDRMAPPFEELVRWDLPELILVDFAPHWVPEIANRYGVPTAFLSVYTAATLAYLGSPEELRSGNLRPSPEHFTGPPSCFNFHSLVAHRPDCAPTMMRNTHIPEASGVSSGQRLSSVIEGCDFVIVRSCKEFEGEYIDLLEKLYKRPVLAIGLLPPRLNTAIHPETNSSSWSEAFEWLDKQRPKSVVFVGFGSEYKMPIQQIHELASALELSRMPFLWILRKPGIDNSALLPTDFVNRTSNQGRVILGWAPQQNILAHPAIGGCLFHSGWGTIIESLGFGHPLILLPMVADQGLNAKLLVEKEIGYEVPRREDGSFSRDTVANSIRLVMASQEGEGIRLKAAQMANIFGNQNLHDNYIDQFIQYFQSEVLTKCRRG